MDIFSVIAFVLFAVGIPLALGITPEGFVAALIDFIRPKAKLRTKVEDVQDNKKTEGIYGVLVNMLAALEATGKGAMFPLAIFASVVMAAVGILIAMVLDNLWLAPSFSVGMALIPLGYIVSSVSYYNRSTKEELETALSIITNSYLRTENIILAVEENIEYIKPPLQYHFKAFLAESNFVMASTKKALYNLRNKVNDLVFFEWVTALVQCQDDRTLKDNLLPIVSKLTDIRLVNNQIHHQVTAVRMEYFTMLGMLFGSIPLLWILNEEWFDTLMYTDVGKFTQGVMASVALITWLLMVLYTRPVEYTKKEGTTE